MSNKNKPDDAINDFVNLWQKQFEHLITSENVISNTLQTNVWKNEPKQSEHADLLKSINDQLCELQSSIKKLDGRISNIESKVAKTSAKN